MHIGRTMKYYGAQVERYVTEHVVGPKVFPLCFTAASAIARWEMVRDMAIILWVFGMVLALQVGMKVEISTVDSQRFTDLVKDFHTLASFLVGFFVSACLQRWWGLRLTGIGGLWGNIDDLCMLIGCYFPRDDAADREVRDRVLRWGVLSHELVYKQAQNEVDISDLVDRGLLLEHERQLLEPLASRAMVIWAWMISYVGHLAFGDPSAGGSRLPMAVTVLPQIHGVCMKARDGLGILFTYTDTQVPFRYVHLISLIVWLHNFLQAANSAIVIRLAIEDGRTANILVEVLFLMCYPLVFLGLINAGASMLNPLLDTTDIDIPRGAFSYYMLKENGAFFKGSCMPTGPPYGAPPVVRVDARKGPDLNTALNSAIA